MAVAFSKDSFRQKQRYVEKAGARSVVSLLIAFSLAYYYQPTLLNFPSRNHYLLTFIPVVVFFYGCILYISVMRAFDPNLIDGSAFTNLDPAKNTVPDTDTALKTSLTKVRVAQAILQNTLEQTVLAAMVHAIYILCLPDSVLVLQRVAVIVFFIGRILFAHGYQNSTRGRAQGFALTILSTSILLAIEIVWAVSQLFLQ